MKWTGGKDAKQRAALRLQIALEKKELKYSKIKNAIQGVRDFQQLKEDNRGCQAGCTEKELAWGYQNKWYCSKCMDIERKSWYKDST